MFYAELVEDCVIVEKGVFMSLAEFLPYRQKGWSGTEETNKAADKLIQGEQPLTIGAG